MSVLGSTRNPAVRTKQATVRSWWPPAIGVMVSAAVLCGCASGPSTKVEVCKTFDELGIQLMQGNGILGLLTVPLSVIADIGGMLGVRVGSLI